MKIELVELSFKVLSDMDPPNASEGAYIFAQTVDNESSVLRSAAQYFAEGKAEVILIPDSSPRCGYPGSQQWAAQLLLHQVPQQHIHGVPTADFESLNTYTESLAVVRYAKQNQFRYLTIIAAPFHQLRAFISAVSAAVREYPSLLIYNSVGLPLPWYDSVSHSQGSLVGRREEFIHSEFDRIVSYQQKGDLISEIEVLEYLRQRDRKK